MKGRAKICLAGTEVVGEAVTLSNSDNTDVVAWRWFLMGTPLGSEVLLKDTTWPRATFTPDRPGKYVIRLEVNEGRDYAGQMAETTYEVRPVLQPHDDPKALLSGTERAMLQEAIDQLGPAVTGLVVMHAGRRMRVHPNTQADDARREELKQAGRIPPNIWRPGQPWEAIAETDVIDDDGQPVQAEGTGTTAFEAMDECAADAERVEFGERGVDRADEDSDINPFRQ